MPLQWTEDLLVGVEEIDSQHKELVVRTNNLFDAMKLGKGRQEIGELVTFLERYAVMHFGLEERYMATYEYPDSPVHKTKHTKFVEEFSAIKSRFASEGPAADLVVSVHAFLTDWLLDHIRTVDKLLGVFLKDKLQSSFSPAPNPDS